MGKYKGEITTTDGMVLVSLLVEISSMMEKLSMFDM
jgi:hypothetical protein